MDKLRIILNYLPDWLTQDPLSVDIVSNRELSDREAFQTIGKTAVELFKAPDHLPDSIPPGSDKI